MALSRKLEIFTRWDSHFFHLKGFLQERRIQRAMEYLLDTDWSISRTAQATGFESIYDFTRVFTKKIGVAPGKFRKTQLSEVPFAQNMSS